MKFSPSLIVFFFFAWLITACGGRPSVSDFQYLEDVGNLTGTVSVLSSFPEENAFDVDPGAEIILNFSGPLRPNSINRFTFRVEDQFGFELPGRTELRNSNTRVVFIPEQNGQRYHLPPGRRITVKSRFLEDSNNRLIGDYAWSFRPKANVGVDQNFRIVEILPKENMILPGGSIAVRFNQELAPPDDTNTLCSMTQWADSFQIFRITVYNPQTQEMEFENVHGEVCLQSDSEGKFNILQFFPLVDGFPAGLPSNSYVDVVVRPSEGLRSLNSGAQLSNTTQQRLFVMPYLDDVIQFASDLLFGGLFGD